MTGPSIAIEPAGCLEGAVGEVAVEAHGDPVPGHQVEGDRDGDVMPSEPPSPRDRYGDEQGQEGEGDEQEQGNLLRPALALDAGRVGGRGGRGGGVDG